MTSTSTRARLGGAAPAAAILAAFIAITATGAQAEPAATVGMTNDLKFTPESITIEAGDTVVWENTSDLVHTVTADLDRATDPDHADLPEGAEPFDSGSIEPGGTYSHTFETPGHYTYFCIPHEAAGMIGEIVVE